MSSRAEKLAQAIDGASLLARRELRNIMGGLEDEDPYAIKALLLTAVPAIVQKYGNMAALAAAQYYEAERSDVFEGDFSALLAEPIEREAIEAKVRYALRYLFEGNNSGE